MLSTLMDTLLAVTGALTATTGAALPAPNDGPVYIAGGQYGATLDQQTRHWRLLPLDGQDLIVANPDVYCRADAPIPNGVWLVAIDPAGGVELRPTSQVQLPPGFPAQVALRACGETGDAFALHAPRALIELLAGSTGAVYVHN